jgi:hypothetical protein
MRTFMRAFGIALAFAVVLFQQSCDNSYGIFEEVQKEREQKGQDIFKKKSVTSIVVYGGNYYAATSSLYKRSTASGSDWSRVEVGGYSDYWIYGLAATSSGVYASTNHGVFELGGTALSNVPSSNEALFAANDVLFLSRHTVDASNPVKSTYELYYLDGLNAFQHIAAFTPATDKSIRGVAYDGVDYYFASEDSLMQSAGPDGVGATPVAAFTKTPWSASTTFDGANYYAYIGTTDGTLYRYRNGNPESVSLPSSLPLTSAVRVPLTAASWKVLIGTANISSSTDPKGYFEANEVESTALASMTFGSGESGAVAGSSSVYSTTIKDLPVNAFLFNGTAASGTLFAGISSYTSTGIHYGLYSSEWTGSSWAGWKAE